MLARASSAAAATLLLFLPSSSALWVISTALLPVRSDPPPGTDIPVTGSFAPKAQSRVSSLRSNAYALNTSSIALTIRSGWEYAPRARSAREVCHIGTWIGARSNQMECSTSGSKPLEFADDAS